MINLSFVFVASLMANGGVVHTFVSDQLTSRTILSYSSGDQFAQATGGPSGGPSQSQYIAPKTSTGGPSGGPNQSQYVMPKISTGGPSGGPNQTQYVDPKEQPMKDK